MFCNIWQGLQVECHKNTICELVTFINSITCYISFNYLSKLVYQFIQFILFHYISFIKIIVYRILARAGSQLSANIQKLIDFTKQFVRA